MSWQNSWEEKCRKVDQLLQIAKTNLIEIGEILEECETFSTTQYNQNHYNLSERPMLLQ